MIGLRHLEGGRRHGNISDAAEPERFARWADASRRKRLSSLQDGPGENAVYYEDAVAHHAVGYARDGLAPLIGGRRSGGSGGGGGGGGGDGGGGYGDGSDYDDDAMLRGSKSEQV